MPRTPLRLAAFTLLLALALPVRAFAWGGATHQYIAQNYSKHLPATIDGLRAYDATVVAHVNDPDIRRPSTPGEAPRHFIDIDEYGEFIFGVMPHDRAVLEAAYGAQFVEDTGIVPWAVGEVVQTLTAQFAAGQWSAAALTIADLCHYVGDASQPLHCTKNYNGQLTGNTGIHSRYETTMMSPHIADLSTPVMPVVFYPDPVDALFGLVSGSWDEVDALLAADNAAKAASGGSYNGTYYNALWNATQGFTRTRIDSATVMIASMVVTAWSKAGYPDIPGSSAGVPIGTIPAGGLRAYPSPFRDAVTIQFSSPVSGAGGMTLDVFDVNGGRVARLAADSGPAIVSWQPAGDLKAGLYFLRLAGPGGLLETRRITLLR